MSAPLAAADPISQATISAPVLMPALVPEPFNYLVPEGVVPGSLVEAPLAGRKLIGVVWGDLLDGGSALITHALRDGSPAATRSDQLPVKEQKKFKLKPVERVLDLPPFKQSFRRWLEWISDFTLAPKGAVLSLCGLTYAAKTPKKALPPQQFTVQMPTLTEAQEKIAHQLLDGTLIPTLVDGVTGSGKTEVYFHAIAEVLSGGGITPTSPDACAAAQNEVDISTIVAAAERGEGKGQVLVLLPEITLTHQWLARFEKTFGAKPVVWHSRMTPVAKARAWQAVARGEVQVVVGARSSLFLPFANLKLIIVDEEHDPSYKQEDGVLYHARDMAVVRARFEQIPVVLASATPSLETLENVKAGKYRSLTLPERFGSAGLPTVSLIDMRNDPPERGDFLSPTVKKRMLETLGRGEQVLLFLNRRGYAPLLLCRTCGHRFECKNCSAWLVVHGGKSFGGGTTLTPPDAAQQLGMEPYAAKKMGRASLNCHHCGHHEPMPQKCPSCSADAAMLAPCGPGVERIAEEVRAMFALNDAAGAGSPSATQLDQASEFFNPSIAVLSSDEAIDGETWEQIEQGKMDIIVGTQMVAKGHHFPRLTFVAVVDADVGLSGADLRAGERTYQMLHQLGGRAGRGELAGTVVIQTYMPDHPVMSALVAHNRDQLMALEARERKIGGWPPFGQLAAILLDGVDETKVKQAGMALVRSAPQDARLTILGPAAAPLSKLRGQFRYRILVKAKSGIHLQRTLKNWLEGQKFSGVRIKIDVNPYYFL